MNHRLVILTVALITVLSVQGKKEITAVPSVVLKTLPPTQTPGKNSTSDDVDITESTEPSTTTGLDYNAEVLLGGHCLYHQHCITPFSTCVNGTCQCLPTFKGTGKNKCLPTVFSCPHVGVLSKTPVSCKVYPDFNSAGVLPAGVNITGEIKAQRRGAVIDSCPRGFFCALHGSVTVGDGHCCPDDIQWCPLGLPDLNRSCNSGGNPQLPNCDYDTQECLQVNIAGRIYAEFCCPKPCGRNGMIFRGDRCYPSARLGENCEINDQCSDGRTECKNGTCQCQKFHFLNEQSHTCDRTNCPSRDFGSSEALLDPMGEILRCISNTSVCPGNSHCSPNGYVCCPTPAAKCSADKSAGGICETDRENQCPEGKSCQSWYERASRTGVDNERIVYQRLGICC